MSEYKIPNPKDEPLRCLVLAYKTTKGIPYDDRSWDSVHFARAAKAAKALLEICGNVRIADSCLMEISQKFEEDGISWTLETIVKHAHDWISKKRGKPDGHSHRARFFKALAERGRNTESLDTSGEETKVLGPEGSSVFDQQDDQKRSE